MSIIQERNASKKEVSNKSGPYPSSSLLLNEGTGFGSFL